MVKHYKCPNCGADMSYYASAGMLTCASCGRTDKVEDIPSFEQEDTTNQENEAQEYHCENCGAVIMTDTDTTAEICSFCGAGVVLSDRLQGDYLPAKVIPFKITKEEAEQAFKKWCRKGLLTPKGFMTADRIKSITGIYVPFFLYDLHSDASVHADCTKVRSHSDSTYNYVNTKYYQAYREVSLDYLRVPCDASEKMNDELMDKLEPFNYEDLKDFKMPYLAGFVAEKYNQDDKTLLPRVKERVEEYVSDFIKTTLSEYSTNTFTDKNISITEQNTDYTLFPVWMVCYDYHDSEHIFAMNGQTGKIVGKPPLSKGKIAAWITGVWLGGFAILSLLDILLTGGF